MNGRLLFSWLVVCVVMFLCGCGQKQEETDKAKYENKVDAVAAGIKNVKTVYMPLQAGTFASLDKALAEKGIGNVTASDMKHEFFYQNASVEGKELKLITAVWQERSLPSGSAFQPMSLRQALDAALKDEQAGGIIFNPGAKDGSQVFLTSDEIRQLLPKLPAQEPLPMKIMMRPGES